MDPQIEELKQLVRQNIALTEENNRQIHKIRRGRLISTIVGPLIWITASLGISWAAYLFFFQPYVGKIADFYVSIQQAIDQAKDIKNQLSGGNPQGH